MHRALTSRKGCDHTFTRVEPYLSGSSTTAPPDDHIIHAGNGIRADKNLSLISLILVLRRLHNLSRQPEECGTERRCLCGHDPRTQDTTKRSAMEDLRYLEALMLLPGLPELQRVCRRGPGTPLLRAGDEHPMHTRGQALHLPRVPPLPAARADGKGLLHEGERGGDPVRADCGVTNTQAHSPRGNDEYPVFTVSCDNRSFFYRGVRDISGFQPGYFTCTLHITALQ